jgi:pimeloyl-ACP methyl ester carboxylesterase
VTLEANLMRRGWPALVLIILALAIPEAWAVSSDSVERAPEPVIERFVYETRAHGAVEAEMGRLQVPENRTRAQSRSLELAFVRLAVRDGGEGPPIVYLAGGPGGSGIRAGQGARFRLFDALRSSGDVILLDQRGVGYSTGIEPEECPEEALYPLDRPLELEPYLALVEEIAADCALFWDERGVDLDAYTTADSVADLEALRRALGVPQIDLLGISYGSHLAMAYLRAHPDRVRRVVLAGAEGPDHTVKLPSQFDAQLDNLQALLDADPSGDPVDVRALVGGVLNRLEREPASLRIMDVEGPDRETRLLVGRRDVAAFTLGMLLDPGSMIQIPALYRRLEAGDFTDVAHAVADMRRIGGLEAMPEAMDAASGISPERLRRLRAEDDSTLLGSGVLLANVAVARGLGVRDLGDAFRSPLEVDVPTLFVSGSLDGRTPRSNAEELMHGFSRARHVVVINGGHSDDLLISSPELERTLVQFFHGEEPSASEIDLAPPEVADGRRRMALAPRQASRYVGEYERREREIWRILHDQTVESLDANGQVRFANAVLQIRWAGNGFPFHPVSETVFYIDFPWFVDDDFRFEFDEAGRVTYLVFEDGEGKTVRAEKVH